MDVIMRANEGTFRRAKNMCNALRELFAEELEESRTNGEMRGRKLGEESGRESAIISNLKSLMDSMKWTIDQAMDALKVPEDQRDHYRKAVQ
jgi:flagellar biosynthesis/type III secretory pathway protein FliH